MTLPASAKNLAEQNTHPSPIVNVAEPLLPPLEEYIPYLESIWARRWVTNSGPFHQELEASLTEYLGVPYLSLVSNGTTALWLALQALGVGGEVITTPFSFVATAHALRLVGATPVFVDVAPDTANIAPEAIEAAITSRTTAILPVHCFGQPCDTGAIGEIAEVHDLHVVYDAAHAFGVKQHGQSVLLHGDHAALSFHATKVFSTVEGGAIVSHDARSKAKIDRMRNFGIAGDRQIAAPSLNGKLNELQAAFGLLQLRYVDQAITRRKEISTAYRMGLAGITGLTPFPHPAEYDPNYSYFPILVGPQYPEGRDALWARLNRYGILARRYFSPLIVDMPGYRQLPSASGELPEARRIARTVLCLPLHARISDESIARTLEILSTA